MKLRVVLSRKSLREIGSVSSVSVETTLCTYAVVLRSVNNHWLLLTGHCEVLRVVVMLAFCIAR